MSSGPAPPSGSRRTTGTIRLWRSAACSSSRAQTSEATLSGEITKITPSASRIPAWISACHCALGGMSSQSTQTS